MVKVLFVCLGNICRSTMAEAVMRHKVAAAGLEDWILVDSAGTGRYHLGDIPHPGTRKQLEQSGISWEGIYARQIERADLGAFDYLVGMDRENVQGILRLAEGEEAKKVFLLSDFVDDAGWDDVPDPWFTKKFDVTYQLVSQGCDALLERLRKDLPVSI